MSKIDVVSANPGWKVLQPEYEGNSVVSVCEDAVVAWGIESSLKQSGREYMFSPVAITVDGDADSIEKYAVESPDGKVRIPYGDTFRTREELLKHWIEIDESAKERIRKRERVG